MKARTSLIPLSIVCIAATSTVTPLLADTTWISTSSTTFSTAGNWNNGLPSTGPQLGIFADSATIQHTLDVAGTARVAIGFRFDAFAGGGGFIFNSSSSPGPGIILRAGGTANGIINNDDNTQTFNVPIKLTSNLGSQGAGAAMVFNAVTANSHMIFNGVNQSSAPWTINLNGATNLTFTGSGNITVGSSGGGAIVNTNTGANGGLIKSGSGRLTLGGTLANTFIGGNVINQGTVTAAKVNALGSGNALKMTGGTFETGGLDQTLGTLDLAGNATIDLGNGVSNLKFSNSSLFDWTTFTLTFLNYTAGSDTIQFGTDNTGLTQDQLNQIIFGDLGNATAQIDANGFLTPSAVPEPSTIALGVLGGLGVLVGARRKLNRK
ncbi:MAG: hypothetical protein JWQ71_3092 [Pedosphaera sp.]|nr:hypothetical protein [Pedosphaera sp.]